MALKKPVVYMGFGKELDAANIVTLKRHYLPLGKIGGKPAWLNPIKLPSADLISCKQCKKVMPLLLQIYCSGESTNSFHRYIYVFMCPNNACQKTCNSDNFRVLRCQLPRQNDFYGFERMLNFEQDGEVDDPLFDAEKYAKLCNVCGALGTKMCARCRCTWYCTKDHQVIDWKEGHKQCCQEGKVIPKPEDKDRFCAEKENSFLFEELGVELDLEEEREDTNSDEEDDDEIEDEKMRQELLKKAQNLMTKYDPKNEMNDLNECEESERDEKYFKFSKVLKRNCYQILRYNRGGEPLLATDHANAPSDVPPCGNCGSKRRFEFQLMPYLLSLIDIDDISSKVDYATVLIYTCSKDCDIKDFGYSEEFAFKQDFIFTGQEEQNYVDENDEN
jgi:pre-rRNA-processing protein TSR4